MSNGRVKLVRDRRLPRLPLRAIIVGSGGVHCHETVPAWFMTLLLLTLRWTRAQPASSAATSRSRLGARIGVSQKAR